MYLVKLWITYTHINWKFWNIIVNLKIKEKNVICLITWLNFFFLQTLILNFYKKKVNSINVLIHRLFYFIYLPELYWRCFLMILSLINLQLFYKIFMYWKRFLCVDWWNWCKLVKNDIISDKVFRQTIYEESKEKYFCNKK